jgi:aminobenzoyl-glutamate utilization protein B
MRRIFLVLFFFFPLTLPGQQISPLGAQAIRFIDNQTLQFTAISDSIWKYAEPSYKEILSSGLIIKTLSKENFRIERNIVPGMPTVFVAEYGKSKPVVALFGEYDADRNASNKVVPRHEELVNGGFGHGGHHNLLGVGSLAAAIAIKQLIQQGKLKCTVRYYGSTAEGHDNVRGLLASLKRFDDVDFSLYWHPSPVTWASTGKWDALRELSVAFSSDDQINEKYAYDLFLTELNSLRDKSSTDYRFTYTGTDTLKLRLLAVTQGRCDSLYVKLDSTLRSVVQTVGVDLYRNSTQNIRQFVPNVAAMNVVNKNMQLLPPITYTEEEQKYTREMQMGINAKPEGISYKVGEFTDRSRDRKMYGYSSDIGEPSWIAPEAYFVVKTLPFVGMHTWQGTVFSGHSIGHKGMIQASKILSLTIIDYVQDKELQTTIRIDFEQKKKFYGSN